MGGWITQTSERQALVREFSGQEKRSRSRIRLAARVIVLLAAVGLTSCTAGASGVAQSPRPERIAPSGAPYSYVVPKGFEPVPAHQDQPNSALEYQTWLGPTDRHTDKDLISVAARPLPQPMTESELAKASVQIDHSVTQFWSTAQSTSSQERVTVGGATGFKYHITGAMSGSTKVDLDTYFLFRDQTELFLNCQWIPADKTQVLGACEEVKRSLVLA